MKKIILYYAVLLGLIVLLGAFLLGGDMNTMSMPELISICALLIVYTVAVSFVGEIKQEDERELWHRFLANRAAYLAGTIILSIGLLYGLINHRLEVGLLTALIAMNGVKLASLIYFYYKK